MDIDPELEDLLDFGFSPDEAKSALNRKRVQHKQGLFLNESVTMSFHSTNCIEPICNWTPRRFYINRKLCPKCETVSAYRRGFRKTKEGLKQRYKCKHCGASFTQEPIKIKLRKRKHMKFILRGFLKGFSYREIAKRFNQKFNLCIHPSTVFRRIRNTHTYKRLNGELPKQALVK